MNKNYQSAMIFMSWLHDNAEAFPTLELEDKAHCFRFKKTFPGLSFYVGQSDIIAWFVYQGDSWDGILVADLPEIAVENDKFFCKECFQYSGKKKTYDSIEALFEEHTIRPFRDWLKRNLYGGKEVLFFKDSGSTWVRLCNRGDAEATITGMKLREYYVAVEPL